MQRRRYLAISGTALTLSTAGCAGGSDSGDDGGGSDRAYFNNALDVIDEELGVYDDGVEEDYVWVDYYTTGNPGADLPIVGGAYAGSVDAGLGLRLQGIAVSETDPEQDEYWIDIEVEWAQQFMNDEISESEYLGLIEETIV